MKITFYTLTILFFSFLLAPHYSQGSNSKYPSDQRQESISIAAKESSDLPLIINEVAGFVGAYAAQDFGRSVALGYGVQFKTALVGAPFEDERGDGSGAVYIFNEGIQIKKLTAPDARVGEHFGYSVAYTDNWFNWIVVGAPGDFNSSAKQTGSAYLFERDWGSPNSWGFNGKITPSDGDDGDTFGRSVAISGDTVVIGAPYALMSYGATYVFKPLLFSWIQAKKLMPTDGEDYYYFGSSVAVEGDAVAVGAPAFTTPGWGYVFKRNQGGTDNWGQHSRLAASNGEIGDNLGASIDISGSTVIAGAPSYANSGAAYFFDLPETKGIIKAKPWIPLLLLDD